MLGERGIELQFGFGQAHPQADVVQADQVQADERQAADA
jgi:hypothetical protein